MQLIDVLKKHGLSIDPVFNRGFIRSGSQWFTGREAKVGERALQWASFGDFARNLSVQWTNIEKVSLEEQAHLNEYIETAAKENRAERQRHWEETAQEVEKEWASFSEIGESPYLRRKGLLSEGLRGCRLEAHERGARTIVPARDIQARLWGYQRIFSEKLDIGDKAFRGGARKEGCFHVLGELTGSRTLYLAEGIATAISIRQALGEAETVLSVFDAGNLLPVAQALRAQFPLTPLVFCADNDQFPAKDGKIYHTGRVKAQHAADTVGNAQVVLPHFAPEELGTRPTDFDDLRALRGPAEVKAQILTPAVSQGGLRALPATNNRGQPTKPSERRVVQALLDHYGSNLLVQNRDVFLYEDGAWRWQNPDAINRIKRHVASLYGSQGGSRDIEAAFKYLLIHAPTPPAGVDLFIPQYWSANFKNGTLHFKGTPGQKPRLEWREHQRDDYHITQLPFNFPGLDRLSAVNSEFEAMLQRVWAQDPDFEDKRRALAQLFGACIMPCYPKIFFLVGKRGSGKSTIIKLLNRLVDARNVSRVDPSHFSGFNMETMVGKLVNMDPDINLHKPIQDDIIKKVIDRIPFRVSRKFLSDLLAPLPPIMVFGGNDLPASMEGATGAYERRVIILRFGAFSAEALGDQYRLDFDDWVWSQGEDGILAFALQGLSDLIERQGHFTVPGSSRDAVKEWDSRSDILGQFLDALEHKELDKGSQYFLDPKAEISRRDLWECFASWQGTCFGSRAPWNQKRFISAMRQRGFEEKKIRGVRYWGGVGMIPSPDSGV